MPNVWWSSLFIARLQPPRPQGSQPKVTTKGEKQPRHDTTRQNPREFEIASAYQGSSYGPWRFIGSTGRKIRNVRFPHRDRRHKQRTKSSKETKENTPGTFGPRIQEVMRSLTDGCGRIATPFDARGVSTPNYRGGPKSKARTLTKDSGSSAGTYIVCWTYVGGHL